MDVLYCREKWNNLQFYLFIFVLALGRFHASFPTQKQSQDHMKDSYSCISLEKETDETYNKKEKINCVLYLYTSFKKQTMIYLIKITDACTIFHAEHKTYFMSHGLNLP